MWHLLRRPARRTRPTIRRTTAERFVPRMLTLEERAVPAAFSVSHEGIGAGIPVTASALFLTGGGDLTIDSPAPGVFDVTSTGGITDVSKKGPGTAITNGFEFIGVANIV